jgi:histidyl-tRNA synthetase
MAACGFGAGDVTMSLLLAELDLWPTDGARVEFTVVYADEDRMARAAALTSRLRAAGRSAQYAINASSLKRQMKAAADAGSAYVVVIGVDGCPADRVRLRSRADGSEQDVTIDEVLAAPLVD